MTQHRVLFLIVVIALCVGVAFLLTFVYRNFSKNSPVPTPVSEPAPEAVAEPEEELEPITHLSGVITGVSGSSFTFRIEATGGEELGASLKERTVTVNDTTTITIITNIEPEEGKREMEVFEEEMREYAEAVKKFQEENGTDAEIPKELVPPTLPVLVEREVKSVSALEVNQVVSVIVAGDARKPGDLSAVSVEVLPQPPMPQDVAGQIKDVPISESVMIPELQ